MDRAEVYLSFYEWLMKFEGVDHRIGDLANDAKKDANFPRRSESYTEIEEYLTRKTSNRDLFDTLRIAFTVFSDDMRKPSEDKAYPVPLSKDDIETITAALNEYKKGKAHDEIREVNEVLKKVRKPLEE